LPENYEDRLERELSELRKEMGNLRRGLFARHSELEKKYQETFFELELLKSSIAKQDVKIWTSRSSNFIPSKPRKGEGLPDLFTCIS
jgi:hypothetical protein